jgi:hypothetical protein
VTNSRPDRKYTPFVLRLLTPNLLHEARCLAPLPRFA